MLKKITKSLTVMVMLLSALFSFSTRVGAEPTEASGVDMSKKVSVTIHKYILDTAGTDTAVLADGTGTRPNSIENGSLKDVPYSIQEVVYNGTGDVNDIANYTLVGNVATGTTDADGKLTFAMGATGTQVELPGGQGIYVIKEIANTVTGLAADKVVSLVSLPMEHPNPGSGDNWLYDVHIYPKDTDIGFVKENDGTEIIDDKEDENYGKVITTWHFDVEILEGIEDVEKFAITDTLDYRLSYKDTGNELVVTYDLLAGGKGTLIKDVDYTVKVSTVIGAVGKDSEQMVITLTQAGLDKIAENGKVGGNITFTFDTLINVGDSLDDLAIGMIFNGGKLEYDTVVKYIPGTPGTPGNPDEPDVDPGDPGAPVDPENPDPELPFTRVYGLQVVKIDANGENKPLAGAEFDIYLDADVEDGVLVSGATPVTSTVTTGADGLAYIRELVPGTYWLVEKKAPSGYQKLVNPMKVTITAVEDDAEDQSPAAHLISVTVKNSTDFELPLTGGAGTLIFTIVGSLLMGGAVLLFVLQRKKSNKEK